MGRPRKTENQLTKDDLLKNKDGVISNLLESNDKLADRVKEQKRVISNLHEMNKDLINDNLEILNMCERMKSDFRRDNIVNIVVTAIITIACCMLFIGIIGK